CRFCDDAPCVAACPREGLMQSKENGIIIVDEDKCDGCGWCIEACPYGAIALHPDKQVPMVCDLCGGDPKCVEFCPEEALELVTEGDINKTWKTAVKDIFLDAKKLTDFIEGREKSEIFQEADKKAERLSEKLDMLRKKEAKIRSNSIKGKISLEDYVEKILNKNKIRYESMRKFLGRNDNWVEADFMVPSHFHPKVVIQIKDSNSTRKKETDVLEDILKITQGKDSDTKFYIVTEEIGWFRRISDLKSIIELQEKGDISEVYTRKNLTDLEGEMEKSLTVSDYGY
ncbi:MAG: 4Fe-4S dicluster domain-containing protein, partial [Thermoproteota archaeon]